MRISFESMFRKDVGGQFLVGRRLHVNIRIVDGRKLETLVLCWVVSCFMFKSHQKNFKLKSSQLLQKKESEEGIVFYTANLIEKVCRF